MQFIQGKFIYCLMAFGGLLTGISQEKERFTCTYFDPNGMKVSVYWCFVLQASINTLSVVSGNPRRK